MESIKEIEQELVDEFSMYDDWMDKYEYIIELGKDLPQIDERFKLDENLIKGCQSRVWLHADYVDDKIEFTADSDAIITKGIIALLVRVLNHQNPSDIVQAPLDFINEIGLSEHLSPTRSNGLVSMVKQMKMYAMALEAKNK